MAFQAALEENRRALHLGLSKIFSEVLSVIAAEHLIEYMMLMTRATMMSTRKCWWGTALIFNCSSKGCDLLYTSCRLCIKVRLCLLSGVLSAPTRPLETSCLGEGHLVEGEP